MFSSNHFLLANDLWGYMNHPSKFDFLNFPSEAAKMVRNYKRETQTGLTSSATMKSALRDHLEKGYGICQAAKLHNIPYPTFRRYLMKIKEGQETKLEAEFKQRQVFTEQQEKELCEYLVRSSQMGFGLSSVECRKLAFELGLKNDIKMPRQWKKNETAGKD